MVALAWCCGCASSTYTQLTMEEQEGSVAAALLLVMEMVCLVPSLTPCHHLWRQSQYVSGVLDSLSSSVALALTSLQPWGNCYKRQDAHA